MAYFRRGVSRRRGRYYAASTRKRVPLARRRPIRKRRTRLVRKLVLAKRRRYAKPRYSSFRNLTLHRGIREGVFTTTYSYSTGCFFYVGWGLNNWKFNEITDYEVFQQLLMADFYWHNTFKEFKITKIAWHFSNFRWEKCVGESHAAPTTTNGYQEAVEHMFMNKEIDKKRQEKYEVDDKQRFRIDTMNQGCWVRTFLFNETKYKEWSNETNGCQPWKISVLSNTGKSKKKWLGPKTRFTIYWRPKCSKYVETDDFRIGYSPTVTPDKAKKISDLEPFAPHNDVLTRYFICPIDPSSPCDGQNGDLKILTGQRCFYDIKFTVTVMYNKRITVGPKV